MFLVTQVHRREFELWRLDRRGMLVWRRPLSKPLISNDWGRLVVTSGEVLTVMQGSLWCFSQETGKPMWHSAPGSGHVHSPIGAGEVVYAIGRGKTQDTNSVVAFSLKSGRELWRVNLRSAIAGTFIAHRDALYILCDTASSKTELHYLVKLSPKAR